MPYQGRTLHFFDPAGTPVELCATMPTVPRMHTKIHTHRGAGALRMDHYQVLVPDVLSAAKFYMDLGFRISDYICIEGSEHVVGTFLHRKNNPWDIVLLTRSGPRFHHGGYVVEAVEDIIRACDVAGNLGFADRIEHGPGRHGHQHSYYLYLRDPDGHRTELLLPGIQVIDIDDEPVRCPVSPKANSNLWGLPAPRTWVEEATNFAGVEVRRAAGRGRADDRGEIPGGTDARGGGKLVTSAYATNGCVMSSGLTHSSNCSAVTIAELERGLAQAEVLAIGRAARSAPPSRSRCAG